MGNRLSKIYTRTGDDGTTDLGNGERIDKSNIRVDVMGDVDELNSLCGVLGASGIPDDVSGYLLNIQHRLFDIGGELAIPGNAAIDPVSVDRLEELIDTYNEDLPALKEFILPGGSLSASVCHLARSVCRRVERNLVAMARNEYINPESLRYINRLSDLFFVLARALNQEKGGKEIFWDSERLKRSV
ncbi:MAG: cob(I)alamin adenosyltransferase [Gammaproteobacteria bacterium]|jgi:cob(I)alamin adenosyltransferase